MAKLLHDGLAKMGLELYCPNPNDRLPTVTTIKIPDGFQWAKVNGYLMEKYALEIAGGLGPSAGKVINSLIGIQSSPMRVKSMFRFKQCTWLQC